MIHLRAKTNTKGYRVREGKTAAVTLCNSSISVLFCSLNSSSCICICLCKFSFSSSRTWYSCTSHSHSHHTIPDMRYTAHAKPTLAFLLFWITYKSAARERTERKKRAKLRHVVNWWVLAKDQRLAHSVGLFQVPVSSLQHVLQLLQFYARHTHTHTHQERTLKFPQWS